MKKFLLLFTCVFLAACSSLMPYKDQNLDYLQGIEKDPNAYRGQVVSFGGEVAGITEDTLRMMLVMKIDAPLYYYATGKGNSLSYEMLLVTFNKRGMPQMTGIKKGNTIKVLARVSSYETRKNFTGDDIAVLHLIAFAVSDHTQHKDFFRPETPDRQLYESWKEGRLFFEESAQDVINRCPKENTPQLPEHFFKQPAATQEPPTGHAEAVRIVFDPAQVSYETLVKGFMEIHDPTQSGGQGPDIGPQYRSEIFYTTLEQRHVAFQVINLLKQKGYPVVTRVTPATTFWPAEDCHWRYYERAGTQPYCHRRVKRFD